MAYLEGLLRGHTGGSEGEHTGYVLEIEIDVSVVENAQELTDEQVAVTGDVVIVDYPERGKVIPPVAPRGYVLPAPCTVSSSPHYPVRITVEQAWHSVSTEGSKPEQPAAVRDGGCPGRSRTSGGPEGAYQVPGARVRFAGASDEGRHLLLVEAIGEGKGPPTPGTLEGGAPFPVPVFFAPEKDQPLFAPATELDPIRAEDEALRTPTSLHKDPRFLSRRSLREGNLAAFLLRTR